jgi:hypothetical protein
METGRRSASFAVIFLAFCGVVLAGILEVTGESKAITLHDILLPILGWLGITFIGFAALFVTHGLIQGLSRLFRSGQG